MKKFGTGCLIALIALIVVVVLITLASALYTVRETEQVVITKFGEPVGEPITTPGLKFKIPFIHKVNTFERRILEWDGVPTEMTTKDKTYIIVDTYGRWRIDKPLVYFESYRNERSAQSRLDDILGSATLDAVAGHELIEVIRTTKDRTPQVEEEIVEADMTGDLGKLVPIRRGRTALEEDIFRSAKTTLSETGIELLDIRFKRINYNEDVQTQIYERMISERQQIAERFRSEGEGEAAKILGDMERDLQEIESEAYKTVQETKGKADAKATEIYAKAYNQSTKAIDFFEFLRTMELYEDMLTDSTVVLSTDSDLFKYLKSVKPLEPSNSADAIGGEKSTPKSTSTQRTRPPSGPAGQ